MPQSIMTTEEYTNTYYPCIIRDMNILKDFVGVPLEYDALTMYINQDLFASAGKVPPKTWDELKDLAAILTTKNGGTILQSGVSLGEIKNVDYWQEIIATLLLQNGIDLANPGAKSKAAADAFIYYNAFTGYKIGSWSDIMPPSTKAFAQGKVAVYFGPAKAAEEMYKENPLFRFRTYSLPQVRKDNPQVRICHTN
jgi:ABC-type glycerol-3-phosphate transport system substrate-binding protein